MPPMVGLHGECQGILIDGHWWPLLNRQPISGLRALLKDQEPGHSINGWLPPMPSISIFHNQVSHRQ